MDLREQIQLELDHADAARLRGNEGRARVCARRAAAMAAREYLEPKGLYPPNASGLDVLEKLRLDPDLLPEVIPLIDHLTQRVDETFRLPPGVDLIADARELGRFLHPY
jgi:hypothetical protein